ncbi:hypothetical protein [Oceanobacillus neutriphilus]|uniref:Uncharacterized protein n=1 Tax=Oceanobacillus neutriphilus TaxID=531815 RepID=A0ABQ2NPN9_9BACI|nr:hypothetical protein [Oceanobacillus neutriphilus]GGP07265.1 hypothetical protein GCM10011346_02560 [Oceanobacillus neutriphilus]
MIEKKEVTNRRYLKNVTFSINNNTVYISDGYLVDGREIPLEGITFGIETYEQTDSMYDIYITYSNGMYAYEVEKTYLSYGALPCYTGENKLFHTFASIEVKTDGSLDGHYTLIANQGASTDEENHTQDKQPEDA